MTTLYVIAEQSGAELGTITRAADGSIQADQLGETVFEQLRDGNGWDDEETFDVLAEGGYSNAYWTVKATPGSTPDPDQL